MGNNESVEPFTSNMYNRRVLAGEFTVVNKVFLLLLYSHNVHAVLAKRSHGARTVDS